MGKNERAATRTGSWPGVAGPACRYRFFDRHGGVSRGPWASGNVGRRLGDDEQAVTENRRRVRAEMGVSHLLSAHQVHGTGIFFWDGSGDPEREVADCDALLTNVAGVGLMVQQADCQAVLLHDPVRHAIAAIHCGWRGSVQGILGRVVAAMAERYGSRPADLQAAISPSLGPCCAEFVNYRQELPTEFLSFQVADNHFDFWQISRSQLQAAGLAAERVVCAQICTCCDDDYFSYRRAGRAGPAVRAGRAGSAGRSGKAGQTGQTGQTGKTGQAGQAGSAGQGDLAERRQTGRHCSVIALTAPGSPPLSGTDDGSVRPGG